MATAWGVRIDMLSPAGNWAAFEGSICWMGQVASSLLFLCLHMGGS